MHSENGGERGALREAISCIADRACWSRLRPWPPISFPHKLFLLFVAALHIGSCNAIAMAAGGRRAGRASASRPAVSIGNGGRRPQNTKNYAEQRIQRRDQQQSGASRKVQQPASIHDVFDYVTEQAEATRRPGRGERGERRMKRTLAEEAQQNEWAPGDRGRRGADNDEGGDEEGSGHENYTKAPPTGYGTAPIFDLGDGSGDEAQDVVREEDDEDIDSDEAFGDSDEERYEDVDFEKGKRKGSKAKSSQKGRTNRFQDDDILSEDEGVQSDASIDDADLVDLSKMLDGDDDDAPADASSGEISSDSLSGVEEDDDGNDDSDRLRQRMEAYSAATGAKRSAEAASLSAEQPGKRRVLTERSEAVPEGEWNAPVRGSGGGALTIEDLMKPIAEQGGTSLTDLRNSAKALRPQSDISRQPVASKKGGGTLSAPLPSIVQDRLDRSAAYDETKAEVQGWQPSIKQLREAEHLSFPLQPDPVARQSTASMSANFHPSNDFESHIAKMLDREGATEKQLAQAEELKMNERGMSAEEVKRRTAELRRMRELLFREEQKAKRVSKIKSKTFRRIARKEKQRELEKMREAGIAMPNDDGSADEEEQMKAERQRAQERATLKHKNAGKWAKSTLNAKGLHDMPEARRAIDEQLHRGEELRRRIQGEASDDDDDYSISNGDDGQSEANHDAFEELQNVQQEDDAQKARDDAETASKKGLWNMKFMKDARDRRAKETRDDVNAFADEIGQRSTPEGADSGEEVGAPSSMRVGANTGRLVFGSGQPVAGRSAQEMEAASIAPHSDAPKKGLTTSTIQVEDPRHKDSTSIPRETDTNDLARNGADINPWLMGGNISSKVSRKKNESIVSKDATAQSKAANRIQRHAAKGNGARIEGEDDSTLVIDPTAQLELRGQDGRNVSDRKARQKPLRKIADGNDDANGSLEDGDSDSDESLHDEPVQLRGRGPQAIKQRELVAEAFAGDDVLADFAVEKAAAIDAERPQEVDTSLPGWGSWGGKGVKQSKKQAEARKARFTRTTAGLDPSKRKDASMENVIINQKRDKKADKYMSKDVPYPYTSRAQYEMAMRNPLGPEWNTRTQHQRLTLPRVVTKPGKVIKPLERLF